jgi:SAM-dependent methyltransferase
LRSSFISAARTLGQEIRDFVRDSTPERRRQRYGDAEYDWDYRVDTTSGTVGWRDRLLGVFHSAYQPTDPTMFGEMMRSLPDGPTGLTFIDLGSGKGRTLLMASEYPFRRIVGVEVLPALHRVAEENIARFPRDRQKCGAVESICADATAFEFPNEPMVLYLFNPLPEWGLQRVLRSLEASLEAHPRRVWVIYHNAILEHLLNSSPALTRVVVGTHHVIYASKKEWGNGV